MTQKFDATVTLSAMALNIKNDDGHPNKMPFSGVLTRVDVPSDDAPAGSHGRLVTISAAAANDGLESLMGMAVNYKAGMDGHEPKSKIGIITAAHVVGDAIHIEGFIYAHDFPEVAEEIKANKDVLGFSYEVRNISVVDASTNPVVVTKCTFTGAAILRKDKAAYKSTSINASIEDNETMTPELEATLRALTEKLEALSASVEVVKKAQTDKTDAGSATMSLVEPHVVAILAAADAMQSAGVGNDTANGHQIHLRNIASHLRAEAAAGRFPVTYTVVHAKADDKTEKKEVDTDMDLKPLLDKIEAMSATIADLKASQATVMADIKAARFHDSLPPDRKTLNPEITTLLAKAGLEAPTEGGKLTVAKVDGALKDFSMERRMEFKAALGQAGLLD